MKRDTELGACGEYRESVDRLSRKPAPVEA